MSVLSIRKAAGLHTTANNLDSVPEGALAKADNCVIRSLDTIESRRGQKVATSYVYAAGLAGDLFTNLYFYGGGILARAAGGAVARDTGSAWTAYTGSATSASSYRLKAAESAGRLYFAASTGVKRLNSLTSTALQVAGVGPLTVDWENSLVIAASNGFFAVNRAVAYSALRARRDPANKEIVGPPASRLILTNPASATVAIGSLSRTGTTVTATTSAAHGFMAGQVVVLSPGEADFAAGNKTITSVTSTTFTYTEAGSATTSTVEHAFSIGTAYVRLTVYVDSEAAAGDILRVYRSKQSATAADPPSDELGLVYETLLTSSHITAGYVQFADVCPDDFIGDPAYFSPSQEGELGANNEPPLCDDLASFDDCLWFGNVEERSSLTLSLLAVGGSAGITTGDILHLRPDGGTAIDLTAGTHFTVWNTGDPFTDVERTAQSIVSGIVANVGNTLIRAEYLSGFDTQPGVIRITHEQPNASSYITVWISAHGAAFNPVLPTSEGDVRSYGYARPNRVMHSKRGQPDAVPAANFIDVGEEGDAILRIIPLGDKLMVLKQRSVWAITGPLPGGSCFRVGGALETLAPDSAAVLQDRLYVLTTQGVVAISEAGFSFVGLPIELDITSLYGSTTLSYVKTLGYGFAYESERSYFLGLPSAAGDTACTQWFVFCVLTGAWTRWPITRLAGGVNPATDLLYMVEPTYNRLFVEKKSFAATDYSDAETAFTISSITSTALVSVGHSAVIGDVVVQGSASSIVTATTSTTITLQSLSGFTTGSATLHVAISCEVRWQSLHMDAPAQLKHLQHLKVFFRHLAFRLATLTVATEQVTTGAIAKSFSRSGYTLAFTGSLGPRNEQALIPLEHGRAAYFDVTFAIREARARWKLQGLEAKFEATTEKEPRT